MRIRIISFFFSIFLSVYALHCSKTDKTGAVKDETKVKDAANLDSDLEQRKRFKNEIEQAIEKEDFSKLESTAHQLTINKERFPGGDWKIARFYEVIYPPAGQGKNLDWPKRVDRLQRWKDKAPDSIYANLALAYAQIGYAWNLRGGGYSNEVSKEGWTGFSNMLLEAEKTLNETSEKRNSCMAWYRAKQFIGIGLGWEKKAMNELFDSAVAAEPLYYNVYEGHAMYLLPRWHGEEGEWLTFAEEASNKVGGSEGDIIYAEICWRNSRYYDPIKFFEDENISYKRIKSGFFMREKLYGKSYRYMNAYCLIAGSRGDRGKARELMNRIGDRWEPDFWNGKKHFDEYKKWAFQEVDR